MKPHLILFSMFCSLSSLSSVQDTAKIKMLNEYSRESMFGGDYKNAIQYAEYALSLSKKINYKNGEAANYNNIGAIYYLQGNYSDALKNYFTSLKIIEELVPKILKTQFFRALLDSNASEHGARMTAMDNATENANELLKELRLAYNHARQAVVTTELTEIMSGANALARR